MALVYKNGTYYDNQSGQIYKQDALPANTWVTHPGYEEGGYYTPAAAAPPSVVNPSTPTASYNNYNQTPVTKPVTPTATPATTPVTTPLTGTNPLTGEALSFNTASDFSKWAANYTPPAATPSVVNPSMPTASYNNYNQTPVTKPVTPTAHQVDSP